MQSNRIYREYETSFVCEIAGQERSFCVRKIRRAYSKLNTMAFVAHARSEQSDTHACSLNKGIGCKSRTRKESVAGLQSIHLRLQARGRIPKVAVILKYCFPCGESPRAVKTGHWKGCHGPERRLKQCVGSKARDRKRRSDAQPE